MRNAAAIQLLHPSTFNASGEDTLEREEQPSSIRRQFIKGAVAAIGGVVASGYVKPSMRSLGVPSLLAAVSGYGDDSDKDKDKGKGKGGKKK